ncbi:hypothetical protein RchiOBHm_Chr5g0075751 [Rosa chinensis]|uniref:Uncharacterized protein n=1 Tax=Rosa chinensis TaxID=74649 RepID=A0A2P6QLI9_ROSCH|nr:hypothetical protein RchiOBHm_Chr5g0075751 [Rosa chinensis]
MVVSIVRRNKKIRVRIGPRLFSDKWLILSYDRANVRGTGQNVKGRLNFVLLL